MNTFYRTFAALATVILLFGTPLAHAETTWFGEPTLLLDELEQGRDLMIADMDNDGDADIVAVTRTDNTGNVLLLTNIGNGEYVVLVIDSNFPGANALDIGDVDEDNDLDIVVCGINRVKYYRNEGNNQFATNMWFISAAELVDIELVSLSWMYLDIAVTVYEDNAIVCLVSDEYLDWQITTITTDCPGAKGFAAGDLDNDGDTDFACAASSTGELLFVENTGNLTFVTSVIDSTLDQPWGVDIGDFEADGDLDIAVADNGDDTYLLYKNDGQMNFVLRPLDTNADGAWEMLFCDIDNDGDDDVFGCASYNHDIFWYEYDANSQYMKHSIDDALIGFRGLAAGDVNGDGALDLAGMAVNLADQHEIHWWSAHTTPDWTEHFVDNGIWGSSDAKAADFDLDGDIDIVGAARSADQVVLYENIGNQEFEESELAPFVGAYALWVDDINNDGYPDVVCASGEANDIRLYTNNGDLSFTPSFVDDNFMQARSVHVFDIDGDGNNDIIGSSRADNDVAWFENMGNGWLKHVVDYEFAGATDAVGVDFDQDGDSDILACGQVMDQLAWYENNGFLNFEKHVIASAQNGIRAAVAADLDGDGDLDAAAALANSGRVMWYENDGEMNFSEHLISDQFDGAFDILAADLSGDGWLDLAASSEGLDSLACFINDGNGGFTTQLIDGDYEHPRGLDAVDINLDGRLDIVAAANAESQIQWWENLFADVPEPLTLDAWYLNGSPVDPDGGNVRYLVRLVRNGVMDPIDLWTTVTYLQTDVTVTTGVYQNIDLAPGTYVYRPRQYVPAMAPAGQYTLAVSAGIYPWTVTHYDSFWFTKSDANTGHDLPQILGTPELWPVNGDMPGTPTAPGISAAEDHTGEQTPPDQYELSSAYPNPFNPSTSVTLAMPEAAELTVTVYNIHGQTVATLADGAYAAGTHRFTFDASRLTSGLYFLHASVPGEFDQVRKLTLMK